MGYHEPLKSETYIFDRRSFLAKTGTVAAGSLFLPSTFNLAQEICIKDGNTSVDLNVFKVSDDRLHYWIDGLHFNELSDMPSRANLALFMNVLQSDAAFVEKVILTDANLMTMGVRHFDRSDQMESGKNPSNPNSGHIPYVMFHNIALDYDKKYYIFYQLKVGTNIILKKYVLTDAKRSVLNANFIPTSMRDDFAVFMGVNTGLITSPFQFYTQNGINLHSARGTIVDINTDNSFRIDVQLMHGDSSLSHYMRYFIAADPVGRILGFVKKTFGQQPDTTQGSAGAMIVTELTEAQRSLWGIHPDYVAKINDCPYIQIFTEDVFDALAKNTIHLV